jgi:hypothetical protein
MFSVMGTTASSTPVSVLALFLFILILLLFGFFKVAFSTLATVLSGVDKEGTSMISKLNTFSCLAASIFDSFHTVSVGTVAAVAVSLADS